MRYKGIIFILLFCVTLSGYDFGNGDGLQITREEARKQHESLADFKALLFADQGLQQTGVNKYGQDQLPGSPSSLLISANEAIKHGKKEVAKRSLLRITSMKDIEVRWKLWAWNALRDLGEVPPKGQRDQLQGVVLEVPLQLGTDTLAAYRDGTARYINQSGKIIIWDIPNAEVEILCRDVLQSAQSLLREASQAPGNRPALSRNCRITLLTFSGNRELVVPMNFSPQVSATFIAGAKLMQRLMDEVYRKQRKEKKGKEE